MAVASKKDKTKADKPKVIPALTAYQGEGCTLPALKKLWRTVWKTKKKTWLKLSKKQLLQAAGLDQYRLHLHNQNELNAAFNLSLAIVDKNDKAQDWLELLERPDYWDAVRLTSISSLLNKAVKRLATHITAAQAV